MKETNRIGIKVEFTLPKIHSSLDAAEKSSLDFSLFHFTGRSRASPQNNNNHIGYKKKGGGGGVERVFLLKGAGTTKNENILFIQHLL